MSSSSKDPKTNTAAATAAASGSSPPKKYIRGKYGKLILNPEHTAYMKQQHFQQQQQTKTSMTKNSSSSSNMDNNNTATNPLLNENESLAAPPSITTKGSKDDENEEWVPIVDDNTNHNQKNDDDNTNNNRTIDADDYTDPISLAYLAQLSREVYNFDGTATLLTPETAMDANTDTPAIDSYLNSDDSHTDGGGVVTTDITTDITTTTNDDEHDDQDAPVTVGNNNTNTNTSSSEKKKSRNEIIQIGPDQFSIYEVFLEQNKKNETSNTNDSMNNQENTTAAAEEEEEEEEEEEDQNRNNKKKKTLIVAIAGTFSPMQHLMNIMPHAYQGLYTAQEFWCGSSNGPNTAISESMRTLTTNNYPNTTTTTTSKKTNTTPPEDAATSAYRNGHVHGWEEPAENIYEELMRRLVHTNTNTNEDAPTPTIAKNNHTTSLYEVYDRILLTGHSRGGLLAYYVGLHILQSTASMNTSENPRRVLRVIGFGMPPPLQEIPNEDCTTLQYVQHNVVSVLNRDDPVANNTLPTFVDTHNWKPIVVDIGAKTKHKAPPKIQPPTPAATSRNSKSSSSSSFWNLLGNVVTAAVTVVADKATELKYDLEQNHTIHQYVKLMTLDTNGTENSNSSSSSSKNGSNTSSRMDGSSDSISSSVGDGVVSTTAASSSSSSSIIITDDRNQNVYLLPSSGVVILGRDSNEHDADIDSQCSTSHNEYSKTRRNRRQLQLLLPSV